MNWPDDYCELVGWSEWRFRKGSVHCVIQSEREGDREEDRVRETYPIWLAQCTHVHMAQWQLQSPAQHHT